MIGRLKYKPWSHVKHVVLAVAISTPVLSISQMSYANDADCAIWLCLPNGFPEGCDPAYQAFLLRLKSNTTPLPQYATCSAGGLFAGGSYSMGYRHYENCPKGFELEGTDEVVVTEFDEDFDPDDLMDMHARDTICVNREKCETNEAGEEVCETETPELRAKPFFIDTVINGESQRRYYFSY